jgi:hypothetical protein
VSGGVPRIPTVIEESKMISNLELRHLVESGFLPAKCICSVDPSGLMTIQVFDPDTHDVEFTVPGIRIASLTSSRAISELLAQIREEYKMSHMVHTEYRKFGKR